MFYGSHLNLVSRRLSGSIAGEIANTVELMNRMPNPADRDMVLEMAREHFLLDMRLEPGARLEPYKRVNVLGPIDDDLEAALHELSPFRSPWTGPTTRARC